MAGTVEDKKGGRMLQRLKSILFVFCVVMIFTAQTQRPEDQKQQHAPGAKHAPAARNNQSRPPQTQPRREIPHPIARKMPPPPQVHRMPPSQIQERPNRPQPSNQQRVAWPHVYGVPPSAPVRNNDTFFHRQHHNHWQPRYNYYDNQYHFYPYVNIASTVELSGDSAQVGYDGQNFYYDQGTFYQQDDQEQYFAIAPPIGIIVSTLPANARQVIVDNQVFYRYKGVFYIQVPQGFQVVGPLPGASDNS